jgi:DNA-directed RNA polymerase subunit RPC12/RpoP
MSYLCEVCNKEFPKTQLGKQEWLMHRKTHNSPQGVVPETATEQEVKKSMSAREIKDERKPEKPRLTYQWTGVCGSCLTPLDSISIEAGQPKGKMITVAFCSRCKKEIAHRQVEKL